MRDGIDVVNAVRGTRHGPVTLALVGTLASGSLTARLSLLCQAHPGLDLRLRTRRSARRSARWCCAATRLWGCATVQTPTLGSCRSSTTKSGWSRCARRGTPWRPDGSRRRGLAGQRWPAFPSGWVRRSGTDAAGLQQLLAAHGLGAAEDLLIDSLTAQKRMAEAGFGLAIFLPESSLDEELRTGTLCAIDAPSLTATIPVALIRRRNAFQSGAARALIVLHRPDWPDTPGTAA